MNLRSLFAISLIALVSFNAGSRAAVEPKAGAISVTVGTIIETRATGAHEGECRVILDLSGDAVTAAHSVRAVRVTSAKDGLGRDLVKPVDVVSETPANALPPASADERRRLDAVAAEVARRRAIREATGVPPTSGGVASPGRASASRTMVSLRPPSRQSAAIKIIAGEIDLFTPSEQNGGLVRVSRFTERPGEVIKQDALEADGIQAVFFTRDSFEKGKLIAAKEKPAFESAFKIYGAEAVWVSIRDPKKKVVDFEVQSRDGIRLEAATFNTGSADGRRNLFLKTPPPAGAQLVIRVATPGAVKTYPFKLENVPLP
jgi:hypothetical protein